MMIQQLISFLQSYLYSDEAWSLIILCFKVDDLPDQNDDAAATANFDDGYDNLL